MSSSPPLPKRIDDPQSLVDRHPVMHDALPSDRHVEQRIAVDVGGQAREDRSGLARVPRGHATRACASEARRSCFEIFPTGVLGSSSRISIAPIISCLPRRSFRNAFMSSKVGGGAPAFNLTYAFGVSPR